MAKHQLPMIALPRFRACGRHLLFARDGHLDVADDFPATRGLRVRDNSASAASTVSARKAIAPRCPGEAVARIEAAKAAAQAN